MNEFTVPAWKDYECDYCRSLVMSCATRDVPEVCIDSYLQVQLVSARKDKDRAAFDYLQTLRAYWQNSARYLATVEAAE